MHHRISISLALLSMLLGGTDAIGKPLSMQPDRELRSASWAAEVKVLSVLPPDRIRVRITNNPALVFRGFAMLGRTVNVKPSPSGPSGCLTDMSRLAGSTKSLLLVVRPSGQIALVGEPRRENGAVYYRLRTWCDFNAWWMFSQKDKFGRRVEGQEGEPMGGFEATYDETAALFQKERAAFYERTLVHLASTPQGVERETILQHITQLGSATFAARERAERQLLKSGIHSVPLLEAAYLESKDIEMRYRLRNIISRMEQDLSTFEFVESIRRTDGIKGEARLLLASYQAFTQSKLKAQCLRRLQQLAKKADPPLKIDATTKAEQLIKIWRERINQR